MHFFVIIAEFMICKLQLKNIYDLGETCKVYMILLYLCLCLAQIAEQMMSLLDQQCMP